MKEKKYSKNRINFYFKCIIQTNEKYLFELNITFFLIVALK